MRKNILVQYDGGGYDGCIWEYNYFYIDKAGTFHNISSSGTGGISDLYNAMDLLENNGNSFSTDVSVYALDSETDMRRFATETACPNVLGVMRFFSLNNDPEAEPFAICTECGSKIVDVDDIQLTDIHGCGGIVSTADSLLCSECYMSGTCGCCNEYIGTDDLVYLSRETTLDDDRLDKAAKAILDDDDTDRYVICQDCLADKAQQIENDERDDLLWLSLTTGKPDMFSDDMRWLFNG